MKILFTASALLVSFHALAQPAPDESDPLIAAVIVFSTAYSIERWESYCAEEYPESAESIAAARSSWMESHSDLLTMMGSILTSRYSKEERVDIAVQTQLSNDELESRLNSATAASRKGWCEQSPKRILSPQMDLNSRATLVRAMRNSSP